MKSMIRLMLCLTALPLALRGAPDGADFEGKIRPFLNEHCTDCHGEQKQKGKPIIAEEAPEDTKVIDLMDALKKSLSGKSGGSSRSGHAKRVISKQSGARASAPTPKARPKKRAGARR